MAKDFKGSGKSELRSGEYSDIKLSGKTSGSGEIKALSLTASGKTDINGDLIIEKSVCVSGKTVVGNLKCRSFEGSGKLDVKNTLECTDKVKFIGAIHAKNINTEKCELSISSYSNVDKIESTELVVRKTDNKQLSKLKDGLTDTKVDINIFGLKFKHDFGDLDLSGLSETVSKDAVLDAQNIVAKSVDVSSTNAGCIVADDVTIGVNCHIKCVKYSNTYTCDGSSIVDSVEKS